MKKRLPLLALATLAACAHTSASAATYSYTGNSYDLASLHNFSAPCSGGNCANFTTAMAPTGTITTSVPLVPNLVSAAIPLANITSFSLFDGLVTYASSDPLVTLLFANATTDNTGQPITLQVTALRWQSPGPHNGANMRLDSVNTTSGSTHNTICLAVAPTPGGDVCTTSEGQGSTDGNTSWAEPGLMSAGSGSAVLNVPVDNPFALALTAVGLLGLALHGRQKLPLKK